MSNKKTLERLQGYFRKAQSQIHDSVAKAVAASNEAAVPVTPPSGGKSAPFTTQQKEELRRIGQSYDDQMNDLKAEHDQSTKVAQEKFEKQRMSSVSERENCKSASNSWSKKTMTYRTA